MSTTARWGISEVTGDIYMVVEEFFDGEYTGRVVMVPLAQFAGLATALEFQLVRRNMVEKVPARRRNGPRRGGLPK